MPFENEMKKLERRREKALAMGGPEKIKRQHDKGKGTARERIAGIYHVANQAAEHYFGENPWVDVFTDIVDIALDYFAKKKTRAQGQGSLVYPEYKHGRYKVGEYALPSLQMNVDAGGSRSV